MTTFPGETTDDRAARKGPAADLHVVATTAPRAADGAAGVVTDESSTAGGARIATRPTVYEQGSPAVDEGRRL